MDPLVLRADDGPSVAVLTLNRPDKRNALNAGLLRELVAAVSAAGREPGRRVLILRGAGPGFCAGMDLGEAADPVRGPRAARLIARAFLALSDSPLVTIACVHGAAVAGGAGLVGACDLAVSAADTTFGYPETRRGLVAALVLTFLRHQMRERDAREVLLTGELFSAERARELGLIARVAPTAEAAYAEARRLADTVLLGGPGAVAGTKRLIDRHWRRPTRADLDRALRLHLGARGSAEAAEGIAAFREKRAPDWGRVRGA